MKRFPKFLPLCLLLLPMVARADWVEMWTKGDGSVTSLDMDSIQVTTTNGQLISVKFWEKTTYTTEQSKARRVEQRRSTGATLAGYVNLRETKIQSELDCIGQRIRPLTVIDLDSNGITLDTLGSHNMPASMLNQMWRGLSPNSEGEAYFQILCQRKMPR